MTKNTVFTIRKIIAYIVAILLVALVLLLINYIFGMLCIMKVEVNNLITIKNYALKENVTTSYIYKLIKEGKMNSFLIDGIQFIQLDKFPFIPVLARRK